MNRRKLARRSALAVKITARHRFALITGGNILSTIDDVKKAKDQRKVLARQHSGYVYILDRSFTPARMVR